MHKYSKYCGRYELKFSTLNTLNSLVHPGEGARDETRFSTLVHPTLPSAKVRSPL